MRSRDEIVKCLEDLTAKYEEEVCRLATTMRQPECSAEDYSQMRGRQLALEVSQKGIENLFIYYLKENLPVAVMVLVKEIRDCIALHTKHYINYPKPWYSKLEIMKWKSCNDTYEEVIKQLELVPTDQAGCSA